MLNSEKPVDLSELIKSTALLTVQLRTSLERLDDQTLQTLDKVENELAVFRKLIQE